MNCIHRAPYWQLPDHVRYALPRVCPGTLQHCQSPKCWHKWSLSARHVRPGGLSVTLSMN